MFVNCLPTKGDPRSVGQISILSKPGLTMFERQPSINAQHEMNSSTMTPTKTCPLDSDYSPTISRYGRSHKPKIQDDYISTDKKVSAYLKLSPGNQIQYFHITKEPKKKPSPKKISPESGIKRGRPPKPKTPSTDLDSVEDVITSIKAEPQDPNLPVDGCEWMVGDLAWGRVGGHPFWPCVIALDPVQKIFTKIVQRGRNTTVGQRWMHVQFFGDNGRRSWLNSSAIMTFNGRDAFMQLAETVLAGMRKKDPKQTSAFVIKPAVVQVWEKAVQEAEDMASATREERIAFFAAHFPVVLPKPITREELIERVLDDSTVCYPKKRGRKRKAETTLEEDQALHKQIKLEETEIEVKKVLMAQSESKIKEEGEGEVKVSEENHALLTSTPRTIADRKKRQALLMQMARSNQMAAADAATPTTTPSTPGEKPTPNKRPSISESTPIEKKKPKRKYIKKTVDADFQNYCSRNFEKISDEHPELNDKEINKHLQNLWNHMDESAKSRYRSRKGCVSQEQEDNESTEETMEDMDEENDSSKSSNEAEPQAIVSESPAPAAGTVQKQSAVKRSSRNLFTGIKSEKVCQICERAGETVRCRGPCQGFYHPNCVTTPLLPPSNSVSTPTSAKKGKRGRPKKSIDNSLCLESGIDQSVDKDSQTSTDNSIPAKDPDQETKSEVAVEVVEAESKSSAKVRKGSKDSNGEEDEGFRCKDCSQSRSQPCFACHEYVQNKTGEAKLYRCVTSNCGKVYHEECLKAWPQTSWRGTNRTVLTCPQHTCHTCVSDNPGVIKARYCNDKLVRCVRCPTSYHHGNYCLPAGSEILTNSQIICPQHYKPPKKGKGNIHHVNAAWCFICASGGSLICCDLCPTAFHADCLKISTPPDIYVCEDCQTGRFPLYGEIVWVKLGCYRWWPAEILYPSQIPDNILNLPHVRGEFAVKFFGSHDHYWVNRGRVFLYQDGDTAGKTNPKKSSVDQVFEKAVREASEAQRRYLEEKASRDAETRPGMKPPNYVKLKTNKPVGNVRTLDMNLSNLTPCECDPKSDNPCAPDSDCLNRILMVECHPQICPAGEKCCNQLFEKRQYPPLQPYQTQERGWGLKTLEPLKKGDFVIEYVGEMIDEEEYKRRLADMHERNEDNFYFLTIDKDRMLDAGPKGNVARFMNHSCQPNCETQKWTVNGDTRVGLFALCDIAADTELVFNYNLESTGNDKKPCMCGAPNCSGFIGVKAIKEKEDNKEKKPTKKKKNVKAREGKCFMCCKEGDLLRCDGKHCTKAYHLSCLGKKQAPQGYWLCPWHQCNICNKGRVRRCTLCVNSYCQEHAEGNIQEDPDSKHLICNKHNQDEADNKGNLLDTKDSSVPMEVDGNSSDNSTVSSLSSDPPAKEVINNNVVKLAETPRLRNRRAKSLAGDITDHGSVEKVNTRRKRPSSVDEALIVSDEKLGSKIENSRSMTADQVCTIDSIAREIICEVIDNLPDQKEGNFKVIDNLKKMNEKKLEEKNDHSSLNGTKDRTDEESVIQSKDISVPKNGTEQSLQEIVSFNETEELTNKINKSSEGNKNLDPLETNKDVILPDGHDSQHSKLNNIVKGMVSNDSNSIQSDQVDISTSVEESTENETNQDILGQMESDLANGFENAKCHSSISESNGKINLMQNGLVTNDKENESSTTKCSVEVINEEAGEIQKSDGLTNSNNIIGTDDHVDDFELSYSENSSDKLFKNVDSSESSIEMKLTDCGTREEDEITRKLEEIHGTKELVNGIEQSSVMEVA